MSKLLKIEQVDKLIKELDKRNKLKIQTESDRALNAEKELGNKVQEVEDMLGGKSLRYVTQAEYDNLSEEEKNNENVMYFITDAEEVDLESLHTHDNMDILSGITQEDIDKWNNGSNIEIPDNLVTEDMLQEVEDMFGGKSLRYVTQAEYDNLSEEDKNRDDITWIVTDGVDLSHTHDNMDILSGITQENIDKWNEPNIELPDNLVTEDMLQEVEDMLGGKSLRYVTQAEYDNLSEEDKNNENVMYFITDAEEVDLESLHTHDNKEFLDGLSQEVLDYKQDKYDEGLNTEDKTIVGSINELDEALIDVSDKVIELDTNKASKEELQEVEDMFGGKALRYVTQVEYDNLSEEDKNNENIVWNITDKEDLTHTHDNKEFLDELSQDVLDYNYLKAVDFDGEISTIINIEPEAIIRPENFGAIGDGVTDDTEAFQAAINSCSSTNGAKMIFLSQKTYVVRGLDLKRYTVIVGCGWKNSFLKIKSGFNGNLFNITEPNANYVQLRDFCILGDKENNTCTNAIYIDRTNAIGEADENWRSSDAWAIINNIRITNVYGNGIYHIKARECRFDNLNISNCNGVGIYAQGSDNNYSEITCWCNKLQGFYILDSNSRFINCKAFANGDAENLSEGFYLGNTMTLSMTSCEAQENFGHGFYLDNTKDSIFNGLLANANGLIDKDVVGFPNSICGIYFNGDVNNIIMNANCNDFRRMILGEPCQKYGIDFGGVQNSVINLIVKNNEELYSLNNGDWIFDEGCNIININGMSKSMSTLNGVRITKSLDNDEFNRLQFGVYNDPYRYEFVGKQANGFQLDVYKNGYTWTGCPLVVDKNCSIKIGTSSGSVGFFGKYGNVKQTSIDNATDLESAIALINNLKAILKSYGLID